MPSRCLFNLPHLPLLYETVQLGLDCAWVQGSGSTLRTVVIPELAWQPHLEGIKRYRPALGLQMSHSVSLSESAEMFGTFSYKFYGRDTQSEVPAPKGTYYNPYNVQRFADVLESNWGIGLIARASEVEAFGISASSVGLLAQYRETLPPSFRIAGGLARTLGTSFKCAEISARIRFAEQYTLGLGGGYGVFAFDSIRVAFPFPTAHISYQF